MKAQLCPQAFMLLGCFGKTVEPPHMSHSFGPYSCLEYEQRSALRVVLWDISASCRLVQPHKEKDDVY